VQMARTFIVGSPGLDPTVTFYAEDSTGSTTYGSAEFHYGAAADTTSDTPDEFSVYHATVTGVTADTDIYCRFERSDGGRLVSGCVCEENLPVNASNGYIVPASVSALGPIYSRRREDIFELAATLWKRAAPKLFA